VFVWSALEFLKYLIGFGETGVNIVPLKATPK
jgi:hypothetical protein